MRIAARLTPALARRALTLQVLALQVLALQVLALQVLALRGLALRGLALRGLALLAPAVLGLTAASDPAFGQTGSIDCAAPACETRVSQACLGRLGAGAVASDDTGRCAAEQDAYIACLRQVAERCGAALPTPQQGSGCAPEDARQLFEAVKSSQNPGELEAFAAACAGAPQADLAAVRAKALRAAAAPAQTGPPAAAFVGDWRFESIVEQRSSRIACTQVIRIARVEDGSSRPWRYGWRGAAGRGPVTYVQATGLRNGPALAFDNGIRFTLADGRLVFRSPDVDCAFRKLPPS